MGKTHCTDTGLRFTSLSSCDGAETQLEHLFAAKHGSSLDKKYVSRAKRCDPYIRRRLLHTSLTLSDLPYLDYLRRLL